MWEKEKDPVEESDMRDGNSGWHERVAREEKDKEGIGNMIKVINGFK